MRAPFLRRLASAAAALALLAGALAVAGAAHGAVALDAFKEHETRLQPGEGADVPVTVPFHMTEDGLLYVKLLVTPFNAVNDGEPNGTVSADRSAGLAGWWIEFYLADGSGAPLTVDGNGKPLNPALGAYVDSTRTPTVFLKADVPYVLQAILHVPREAALPGTSHRVPFALVHREGEFTGDGTSGGRLEQSKAFTETIVFEGPREPGTIPDAGPGTGAGAGGDPDPDPASGNETGSPDSGGDPGAGSGTGTSPTPPRCTCEAGTIDSAPAEASGVGLGAGPGTLTTLLVALVVVALALSVVALVLGTYAILLLRREWTRVPAAHPARADGAEPHRSGRERDATEP